MAKAAQTVAKDSHQKDFCKRFESLCGKHSRWGIWSDFILFAAVAVSNAVDKTNYERREEMYMTAAKKYTSAEMTVFSEMLGDMVCSLEANPEQDFLGHLYMGLNLGNDHAGQFFTPYNVCQCMAAMSNPTTTLKAQIQDRGWVAVNDPACGAGATLIAFASECRKQGIDYQRSVLFTGQDIDYTVGLMCYLQLSFLGCPGYVTIGDTLLHPATSYDGNALLPVPNDNIWYTPFYFRDVWHYRRLWTQLNIALRVPAAPQPDETSSNTKAVPEAVEPMPEPEPAPEPVILKYEETAAGQLSFF